MLLNEFENIPAIIEPTDRGIRGGGEICDTIILPFAGETVQAAAACPETHIGGYLQNLNGKHFWYIYEKDKFKAAVSLAPVGAPALVGHLEELNAKGFRRFIIMGTCGFLDETIKNHDFILPAAALRDEGTSYHYAAPSDEIAYDSALLSAMSKIFDRHGIGYITAKTWTTDAFYRETPAKAQRRLAAGAQVVDMEAAAVMAWAQFRKVPVYQFFYPADYVNSISHKWETRRKDLAASEALLDLALTIAKEVEDEAILET
ncbi:phosphorylase [Streptococcus chenjunshii]|uniref:Uridine phosphorylase n=1 Tax=Streptococcus chenjunshii TaxID=2173853 RepID=A0A372KIT8_9STRE|nr:nucleoside phosphorylase [Streptococcus chenjunshii]AXQ79511.1 phosphorylase [Streptococcus chenjunshii]RFU50801.1 phosphorylase [Streptococcus chenjunshii]RFU52189.1 phosphorylase [Streptococcus chenjunshii]